MLRGTIIGAVVGIGIALFSEYPTAAPLAYNLGQMTAVVLFWTGVGAVVGWLVRRR